MLCPMNSSQHQKKNDTVEASSEVLPTYRHQGYKFPLFGCFFWCSKLAQSSCGQLASSEHGEKLTMYTSKHSEPRGAWSCTVDLLRRPATTSYSFWSRSRSPGWRLTYFSASGLYSAEAPLKRVFISTTAHNILRLTSPTSQKQDVL